MRRKLLIALLGLGVAVGYGGEVLRWRALHKRGLTCQRFEHGPGRCATHCPPPAGLMTGTSCPSRLW